MKEVSSLMRNHVNTLVGQRRDWERFNEWRAEMVNRLLWAAMLYLAEEALEVTE